MIADKQALAHKLDETTHELMNLKGASMVHQYLLARWTYFHHNYQPVSFTAFQEERERMRQESEQREHEHKSGQCFD